jgi:glycosyltransferase involved in cell wall biosynthesis
MVKQGYDVLLVGRRMKSSFPMESRPYVTKRMKLLAEKGPAFYAFFNFRLFFFLLFKRADILVSNDLDTLLPNVLVSRLKRKPLVYDSHEYFTEVPELINRPKVQGIWERIERYCMKHVKQAITVNQSIQQRYEEKHKIPFLVVRNISPLYRPTKIITRKELNLPENTPILIMQGAGLNVDRGVEEAIRAMEFLENVMLILVGDGDIIPAMKNLVEENSWSEKVRFFGKRPYQELMHFTRVASLGLSFDQPTNPNYLYSLPNKVFDYIHTQTPILCSNVVEVKRIVEHYDLGEVVYDFTPKALANQISSVLADEVKMNRWKDNCLKTAEIEQWDFEVQKLEVFYPKQ